MVYVFAFVPLIALVAAVPLAWGWGLSWLDVGLAVGFYLVTMLGVTVGFHRYFTHGAFRAARGCGSPSAVAGSMAVQGPIRHWVADHRRHHAFADHEGDPHSPWLFGTSPAALVRGFWHAHMGWIFDRALTNQPRFAPDLVADPDMRAVNRSFTALTLVTVLAAADRRAGHLELVGRGHRVLLGEPGAGRAEPPRGLVDQLDLPHGRRAPLAGPRPLDERLAARDPEHGRVVAQPAPRRPHLGPPRRRPGSDRHLRPGLIWIFEKLGWVTHAKWPTPRRLDRLAARA